MKVSIIIINYNDKERVCRAIDSALNQTWQDKEVILVDDGSDAETRALYKKYDSQNFKLVQLERADLNARTPSRARNEGFKIAKGEYICFLDSDNYFDKNFVEELIKPGVDVSFCDWQIVGKDNYNVEINKVWQFDLDILQNYLMYTHLDHQCLLIKRSLLERLNKNKLPYDIRLPRSQDCDVIVGLMMLTKDWKHVDKSLFVFEKHEEDQMKQLASIHGKTLWSLKRGLNIQWLSNMIGRDPKLMLCFYKAIDDFINSEAWAIDYKESEFKLLLDQTLSVISKERKEKCQTSESLTV